MSRNPGNHRHLQSDCDLVRDTAEAYALGALEIDETERITRHIAEHAECMALVSGAFAVVEALPYSMPLVEGPDLAVKLRLFDAIAAESAPPVAASTGEKLATGNAVIAALNAQPATVSMAPATPSRSWMQYLGTAVAVPLAIALTVVSLWAYNLNQDLDSMEDQLDATTNGEVVTTSIEMYTMDSSNSETGARGSIGAMPNQTSAVLLAWDLNPDEDHEVWCEERNGKKWKVSALEVSDSGDAMQTIQLPKPLDGYKSIYVSAATDSASEGAELILTIPEKTRPDDSDISTPSW